MNHYRDIIKAPIVTEKSNDLLQNKNTVVFSVDVKANKTDVKIAVEKLFNVKVENVNIVNVRAKDKKVGRYAGKTNRVKKAYVKLQKGSSIELS